MSFTEILSKLGFCSQKDKQELQEDIRQNTVVLDEIKVLLNSIYEQQEKKSFVLENRLSLLEENQRKLCLDIADRLDNIKEFVDNNLSKAQDNLSNNIIELKNVFDDNLSKQNNLLQDEMAALKQVQQENKVYIAKVLNTCNDNVSKMQAQYEEKYNNIINNLSAITDNQTKQKANIISELEAIGKEITTANKNVANLRKTVDKNSSGQLKKDDLRLIEELLRLIVANNFINDIKDNKTVDKRKLYDNINSLW
ncbi:hypothetical protein [Megamonas hypermegale]|uniref:hypothetical protein n=1 Tax=Megamonas hypermegale TaxID=158847 RepID=UPI0026F34BA5|nr:hypothetical protein [Megamonas hypermegale]